MSKRIERDGKFYRMREGRFVEIPPEWVGNVTHKQTISKRQSKSRGIKRSGYWFDLAQFKAKKRCRTGMEA